VFTVSRTGDTLQPLTVRYAIAGSALHGVELPAIPDQLTIPAGASTGQIVIRPIDHGHGLSTQTAVIQLRSSAGYSVGAEGYATVHITNDVLPYARIEVAAGPAVEGGVPAKFLITTTGTGTGNVVVKYQMSGTAVNGVDYRLVSGTVSMAKNATSLVTITPLQNTNVEAFKKVTATLVSDPSYSTGLDSTASDLHR